ncbi:hypothetical protein NZD89_28550 (plasmid) [Alicyclobacillus fastidiosus]|uniref:Uncharacterized protein n=1 Tax=Alicyclobacillus fastidiosus TaxID=392011 RepID=A0ABY6ZS74_9BACL|nr:hypothetical protein [Alicyclobacillus fastidiosus]WAH44810.1 hypothetical protein NZD89_28550 [Alicyclobacillus fastidiosus]GMA65771.1 hypothetical protein GCM10025859_62110 [Alicyclobacillus fastidiosus]
MSLTLEDVGIKGELDRFYELFDDNTPFDDSELKLSIVFKAPKKYRVGDTYTVQLSTGTERAKWGLTYAAVKTGTVIHVGRRFAVLDFGDYRESFFFDELDEKILG